MKISELILALQLLLIKHGDVVCYCGGTDYPDRVDGAAYTPKYKGDGYTPGNTVSIY